MNNAERQKRYRNKKRNAPSVTRVTVDVGCNAPAITIADIHEATGYKGRASLDDYLDEHGRKYIPRREPDKLNWGPWMDSTELEQAGLKANRVSIPGDWDYQGVAQEATA